MKEYLTLNENKKYHIDDIKIINDFTKLYINSIKRDPNVSYGDLIAAQILGSFTAFLISFGLFFLVVSLVNEYIFRFGHLIPNYVLIILIIVWFFYNLYFYNKKKSWIYKI